MSGLGRAVAGLGALALLGAGCLPRQALSRRDELQAERFAFTLAMDVETDGLAVAPFRWTLSGTLDWAWTRSFRDGSMGHLLQFPEVTASVTRGGESVSVVVPFASAVFEARGFSDGELLQVAGVSQWSGENGHIELLDVLWPALSPHLPASRAEAEAFTTSWPAWVDGGPRVRHRLRARWQPDGARWTYAGALESAGGNVRGTGSVEGEVRIGEGENRIAEHRFVWNRTLRTRWPGGAEVGQTWRIEGSLRYLGAAPAPELDVSLASDDAVADAAPLRLRDGRSVEAAAAAPPRLPFVLLPDDLPPDERAALRATLTGAW